MYAGRDLSEESAKANLDQIKKHGSIMLCMGNNIMLNREHYFLFAPFFRKKEPKNRAISLFPAMAVCRTSCPTNPQPSHPAHKSCHTKSPIAITRYTYFKKLLSPSNGIIILEEWGDVHERCELGAAWPQRRWPVRQMQRKVGFRGAFFFCNFSFGQAKEKLIENYLPFKLPTLNVMRTNCIVIKKPISSITNRFSGLFTK
jgi:hypothetical protein